MARVTLENVSVHFPVYGAQASSLRQTLASAATGGRIGRETGKTVIEALHDISIGLRDGDRLGVVGHNGSGKTTLLRTLAGIYPPTRGRYSRTGMVSSLIDPMLGIEMDATGYENISIRGLMLGLSRREISRLTPDVAEFSGLGDYLSMPVRTYSTGMLMRLGFSIATSIRTDILLMDEWLAVGDNDFKQLAEERLREIVANSGILVLASHSPELIARECNTVLELSHGRVVGQSPAREAPRPPSTPSAHVATSCRTAETLASGDLDVTAGHVSHTSLAPLSGGSGGIAADHTRQLGRVGTRWYAGIVFAVLGHIALALFLLMPILSGRSTFVAPGDSVDQSFCWLEKVFAAARHGEVALWDFSNMAGVSFVGEMQTAPLYPVAWAVGLLTPPRSTRGMDLFLAAHFLVAAMGVHALGWSLGLSGVASFVAAMIFAYGSTFGARVCGQPNLFASLAWMPWIAVAARSSIAASSPLVGLLWALACGGFLGLGVLAGHAHGVVLAVLAAAVFAGFVPIGASGWRGRITRSLLCGGIAGAVGAGLSLPQLVATREYLRLAYKWYGPGHTRYPHVVPYDVYVNGSLAIADFQTALTGRFVEALDGGTLFVTLTGLTLAMIGAVAGVVSRRSAAGLACLTLAFLSLCCTLPVIQPLGWACHHLPLVNLVRAPARWLFSFALAGALLAGVGLDALRLAAMRLGGASRLSAGRLISGAMAASVATAVFIEIWGWLPPHITRGRSQASLNAILDDPVVRKLTELSGPAPMHRYYASREDVAPNVGDVWPLLSVHGYRSSRTMAFHDYFDFDPLSRKADALGIRWWVTRKRLPEMALIAEVDGRFIHERPTAPPVFWQPAPAGKRAAPDIDGVDWRSNEVRVRFREPIEGRLVFAQTEFPGFQALADDVPVPIVMHEGLMAVDLPAPTRVAKFAYAPRWFAWTAATAVTTLVAVIAAAATLAAMTFAPRAPA